MDRDSLLPCHGGYRKLKSFQLAQLLYDLTVRFCDLYVNRFSRTRDQMVQAARSGVQNIAEGSQASGTSKKTEMKLTNVARASLEELRLDYEDFLRQRGLEQWPPEHPGRCGASESSGAARWRSCGRGSGKNADEGGRARTKTDSHGQARTCTDRRWKSLRFRRPCLSVSVRVRPCSPLPLPPGSRPTRRSLFSTSVVTCSVVRWRRWRPPSNRRVASRSGSTGCATELAADPQPSSLPIHSIVCPWISS